MIKHCPLCQHIYDADETHECPTPEYTALHDKLVALAAEAYDLLPREELG